jgi:hypothetical protein
MIFEYLLFRKTNSMYVTENHVYTAFLAFEYAVIFIYIGLFEFCSKF